MVLPRAFFGDLFSVLLCVGVLAPTPPARSGEAGIPEQAAAEAQPAENYKIGAYYFGYWGPHFPEDQLRHYRTVYHHEGDWWSGVRDLHEPDQTETPALYPGDFGHLKPEIGYYDLSRPAVVETQIAQAAHFGLDYFNFYFYWNSGKKGEKYGDGLKSFLLARNRNDIHFMLSIVADPSGTAIPAAQFDRVATHIAETYLSLPNYLKAPDGRPLVEILDDRGIGGGSVEDVDRFLETLRRAARRSIGVDIFLLAATNNPGYTRLRSADGYTCSDHYLYPEGPGVLQKPYESYIDSFDAYFKTVESFLPPGVPMLLCVISGHDERPRLYLNPGANTPAEIESLRARLTYYTDRSPELFRRALVRTKALMDEGSGPLKNYLVVYAWNEWNEGGIIEPNVKDGTAYLNVIAHVFGAPRTNPP